MILDEILANKRREVAARRAQRPLALPANIAGRDPGGLAPAGGTRPEVSVRTSAARRSPTAAGTPPPEPGFAADGGRESAAAADTPRLPGAGSRFVDALRQPGISFIAEVKRRSPSGGEIRPGLSVADMARTYAAAGAAALSVLTDARYFGGADADLTAAQAASDLPALRKDFVIDPYQILEARELGAEAVLLIVRALADAELRDLLALTEKCGMAALVEAHSAVEVQRAVDAGARIVGVNNRDLDTLTTDVSLAPRLRPLVPADCVFVAESGISQPADIARLLDAGVDAVLIGEALLRAPDPGAKLRTLVAAGRQATGQRHYSVLGGA